ECQEVEFLVLFEILGEGASWSTVVEEGEPVDSTCFGGITSARGAITSGAGGSILGE
nr:hypothetical protein [Tanacetum cinerariifolium]